MIDMILLDLDPNVVKPGWTPALITLGLAVAIVLLYLSMRNQVRRINVPYEDVEPGPDAGVAADPENAVDSAPDDDTPPVAEVSSPTKHPAS